MSQTAPAQARTGYRRHREILALLAVHACLAGCTVGALTASPSGPVAPHPQATSPSGTVTPRAGTATPIQERLGAVSWPTDGVSAADISGIGITDGPGATRQVSIASVAKLMTAYVILQDHPLSGAGSGPDITVEPSEAAAYPSQARHGDSLVAVAAGEAISERHALEALLLPSADNMAWILARWDAGSQDAFVARMNATARTLGMNGTSYTDPSGLDPSTTSTAADQVRLGMAAMQVQRWPRSWRCPRPSFPWPAQSATPTRCWVRTGSPASRPAARRPAADAFSSRPGKRSAGARP